MCACCANGDPWREEIENDCVATVIGSSVPRDFENGMETFGIESDLEVCVQSCMGVS